jgi:hypothetical protein
MELFSFGQDARGVIAVGQRAVGVVAIGQDATGLLAVGQIARGVVAVGMLAFGIVAVGVGSVGLVYATGLAGVGGRPGRGLIGPLVPVPGPARSPEEQAEVPSSPWRRPLAWSTMALQLAVLGVVTFGYLTYVVLPLGDAVLLEASTAASGR